ncbi:MAG: molybdopterin-dependent oxidoreductase [Nitrospirota bacterium]|nr:molybdopterin-dependent oxidoreductase [Nitrospirota bacterium]MDH5585759.1 molybdopterin-dependent oxidoreductase [Nitrospirota bacterium]MDH5774768.1 molybdopterin-dependent oxidoreductase [Nitrospirota bacterium]
MPFTDGLTRRRFLQSGLIAGGLSALGLRSARASAPSSIDLPFDRGHRPLVAFPEKRPLMVMTTRPPQLETPFPIFDENIFTPNDAFFVRWHLAGIPTTVDLQTFRLTIRGRVKQSLSFSLTDLQSQFESIEVAAVCQCAGNSRGFSEPQVAGGQWGHGAMGNAIWKGVRLRDVLEKAGVEKDAKHVRFDGLDRPVADVTPDFLKSLPLDKAMADQVLVAYAMNGEPLPFLNGFPLRLVVPGWYATYWVKMLNDIEVLNHDDHNFWMDRAYRIPHNACGCLAPGQKPTSTVPLSTMPVRSFITNVNNGATLSAGKPTLIKGIAFDQGYGIDQVLLSIDGGQHWDAAQLGKDYGDFSFRPWEIRVALKPEQSYRFQSLAINRIGESQQLHAKWNPNGYLRNAVETVHVATSG